MAEHEEDFSRLFRGHENPDQLVVGEIETRLTTNLIPVAPIRRPVGFAFLFAAAVAVTSALSVLVLRPYGWDNMDLVRRVVVFGCLGVVIFALSLSLAHQMVPGSRVYISFLSLLGAAGASLLVVFAGCFQMQVEPLFFASGMVCLGIGTPVAIVMVLLLWWLIRRGMILSEGSAFATVGGLAGLAGATVLELHCPNFDLLHIVTWHLGIPFAGALLGMFWAKLRSRSPLP